MTARIRHVFAWLLKRGFVYSDGSPALYPTHVQGGKGGQEPAQLSDLLRDTLLTTACVRQPRQNDQGAKGRIMHCDTAARQAGEGALVRLVGVGVPVRLIRVCGFGLAGAGLLVGVGCVEATNGAHAAAASASGPGPNRAVAAPTPGPPGPARATCPSDMLALSSFCMDRYEAPNVQGELPLTMKTAADGEAWCAERGKRLCTEEEWVRACRGPQGRLYPYGDEYRASVCNDDRRWIAVHWERLAQWPGEVAVHEAARLFQAEPSGVRDGCVSEEGVYDLTGNVAEWVRRSDVAPRPGYDHVLKGCYWAGCYHEPHPNCVFRNSAHPGSFRTYEAGFRCCRASVP